MYLEQLVEQVAERVVAKLLERNLLNPPPRKAVVYLPPTDSSNFLDKLAKCLPIEYTLPASKRVKSIVVDVITKPMLDKLYEYANYGAPTPTPSTMTKWLRAKHIHPYTNPDSRDKRGRFYIGDRQVQCYVLGPKQYTIPEMLKRLAEVRAEHQFLALDERKYPPTCAGKY